MLFQITREILNRMTIYHQMKNLMLYKNTFRKFQTIVTEESRQRACYFAATYFLRCTPQASCVFQAKYKYIK